jgi:signal transduction histidine kinase
MASMFVAMVFYTERTKAATAAQQRMLERERDFVRDASHELRTPITIARGHVELLRESAGTQEAVGDADVVLDEINRLASISDRLLILAAAEHADFLDLRPVSVAPFLSRVVRRWETTTPRAWQLRVSARGWFPADQDRLELAIDSLIENAVKFTAPGDRIVVSADRVGEALAIEVGDSGEGIPADQISRIFDRFARADTDRTRARGGTGLGLAIVKAIVEAHGGRVAVQSAPGAGSAFRLELPGFHADADDGRPPAPAAEPVAVSSGGR